MKAIFIKFYGSLSLNILLGALIDLGVPSPFLKAELKEINDSLSMTDTENHKTQVPARYFSISEKDPAPLTVEEASLLWKSMTASQHEEWETIGQQVIKNLADAVEDTGNDDQKLMKLPLTKGSLAGLYLFLDSLDYLQADSIFTCPFSLKEAKDNNGKIVKFLLHDALTTTGDVFAPEGMEPVAAALIKTLSKGFIPMDGRFLLERTAYGTSDPEHPDGNNTGALYLGYFHDREESVFGKNIKIFGVNIKNEDNF